MREKELNDTWSQVGMPRHGEAVRLVPKSPGELSQSVVEIVTCVV